jgi:hypothetical protein
VVVVGDTVIGLAVEPVFHRYEVAPLAVRLFEFPRTIVLDPLTDPSIRTTRGGFTVISTDAKAPVHPWASLAVTL